VTTAVLTEASTSKSVSVGNVRLHYNEAGKGPAVIMIHGGGPGASGWSNFNKNIGAFSGKFRTLLVDMPGFGKSDPVVVPEERLNYQAKTVRGFMDALGIQRAHFVGNSMGGGTSCRFAMDYPDRIDKLVIMGPAGGGIGLFNPQPMEGIRLLMEVADNPTKEGMRRLIQLFVYDSSFLTDQLLEERLKAAQNPAQIEARRKSLPGLADLSGELGKIKAPALLIWGQNDRFVPLEHAMVFLSRIHIFSKCGHWAQWEKADEFNRLVDDFLSH
jgi:2,6-dioxo-6-phenylhexa-3-enoate hydrolase